MALEELLKYIRLWKWWYFFWTFVHYALGTIAIAAPIIAGANLFPTGGSIAVGLTITSALSAAFLTFLRSNEKAMAFLQAYNYLENALLFHDLKNLDEDGKNQIRTAFEKARNAVMISQATGSLNGQEKGVGD